MKKEEQQRLHHPRRQFLQHEQRRPCKQAVSLVLLLQLLLERNGCTTVAAHDSTVDDPDPKGFLAQRKNPDGSGPHRSDLRPASLFQCASNPWKCVFGGAINERAVIPGDQHPVAPSTSSRGDSSFFSSFVQSDKEHSDSAEKKDTPAGAGTGVSSQTKVELESFLKVETEESGAGGGAAVGQNQDGTSLLPTSGRSFIATTVDVDGGTSDINRKTTQANPTSSPSSAFPSSPQVPSVRSTGESGAAQHPHGFLAPRFLEMTRTTGEKQNSVLGEKSGGDGAAPPPGGGASAASTGGYVSRLWGRMRDRGRDLFRGTARAVKGVVPLVAAGTKVAIHSLTGVAEALLNPSGKEKVSAIRSTLLDETERLQNAASRKLSEMHGVDFVHEDPKVESVFRIFELIPRFIGKLEKYNSPNQRNAATLTYIDLQKQFLRRHWERPGKTSLLDKVVRRMVLGSKGTGVEDDDHQDQEDADIVGGTNAADADAINKPDTNLQAPLFPIFEGGSGRGAGAGAEIGTGARVVVHEDQWSIPDEEQDETENERQVRTFLSRTMDYCDALYRACSVAASVRYAFRDLASRLKAYIEQDPDPVIRNTKVITAELTAKLFEPAYAILLDDDTRAVVVVIRGTLSINDVLTDLTSTAVAVEPAGVGKQGELVHDGMYEAAKTLSVDKSLAKQVLELLNKHGYRKVVLTGHSLGGGTAALLYSLWARDDAFQKFHLFAAAHACPAVASLKFTEKHFYDHYDRTRPRPATPAVTGSRFFAATVVGWDVVPRASHTAVQNLQRCVGMLCDWRDPGRSSGSSSAQGTNGGADAVTSPQAGPDATKMKKLQTARELWKKAHDPPVKLEKDDEGYPQLLVPGEKVFFVPLEMEGGAVWKPPNTKFFDEIVLTANMISTHMPDVYARELRRALDEIRQEQDKRKSAVAAALSMRNKVDVEKERESE